MSFISLVYSVIYESGLFCFELQSFGDKDCRDVCPPLNIIRVGGTGHEVLFAPEILLNILVAKEYLQNSL